MRPIGSLSWWSRIVAPRPACRGRSGPGSGSLRRSRAVSRGSRGPSWIDLDAGFLDDLGPMLRLAVHQRAERLRRATARINAKLCQRLAHLVGLERLVERFIQPRDDRGG